MSTFIIKGIRPGKGTRAHILYAQLYDGEELSISATLDYIVARLPKLIKEKADDQKRSTSIL